MKMITVKLQGKEVRANLLNPEVSKKFEEGFDRALERFNGAINLKSGSDGIREQCQATIDYVTDIFGADAAKQVFSENTDLLECVDVLGEMQSLYEDQVVQLVNDKVKGFKDKLAARRGSGTRVD